MSKSRASRIQLRLFEQYGHGYTTTVAEALGLSREHLSRVLNEKYDSPSLLDKIETWLEAEQSLTEKAA